MYRRPLTLAIRREDPARIWERRSPLTPAAVRALVDDGVSVLVQPCDRRVFPMSLFLAAGAQPHPSLDPAHIILGIKEPPLASLLTNPLPLSPSLVPRTHFMFSHTTKGQSYNMPLLSRFLHPTTQPQLMPRLIDFELLTDRAGKRTVGFGWYAGVAGALESLSALAHLHLELGVASPFLYTPRPHTHPTISSLRTALRAIGSQITADGTPPSLGPFIIGLTGSGNVSQGVLSILKELPLEHISPQHLPALVSDPNPNLHKIYLTHALPSDYLRSSQTPDAPYNRAGYYANPQSFHSEFHLKIAPYLTLLINGVGWSPGSPRLMTTQQLTLALQHAARVDPARSKFRFRSIGDISCDVNGGLEFMPHASTLSTPFYTHRPPSLPSHLPPIQIMSVDILPASLPLDASIHFSSVLLPYLRSYIHSYRTGFEHKSDKSRVVDLDMEEALERATVAKDGKLVGTHTWLAELVNTPSTPAKDGLPTSKSTDAASAHLSSPTVRKKKVLMLGSGMVAGPAIDEICKRQDVQLLVGSNSLREAENLTAPHVNASAVLVDMTDLVRVSELVAESDVVISLLPVPFHPSVADLCIQHRKHLITASYISPTMKTLHDRAISADVLLLNEIGLDPGIDHCSAHALIKRLRTQNKRVLSFISFCGGLPAPDSADVPLGYKFSWSPKGVLTAALNPARFRLAGGPDWEIPGTEILNSHFSDVPVSNVLRFEGIANRDSLPYADVYDLGPASELRTLLRGTLRYPGYCDLLHSFRQIGLLETQNTVILDNWLSFVPQILQAKLNTPVQTSTSTISALSDLIPTSRIQPLIEALEWLSLMPTTNDTLSSLPLLPTKSTAPIDLLAILLAHRLRYAPNERDLVVLSHEFIARPLSGPPSDSSQDEIHTSSLITYGTPSATAMSRCVGLPVAFAALKVLDGGVRVRGVQGPTDAEVYNSVLDGLQEVGLGIKDTMRRGAGMEETLVASFTGPR